MAKALTEVCKKEPKLNVRVGSLRDKYFAPGQITALAELPPRKSIGRYVSSMQSPLAGSWCVAGGATAACVCYTGSKGCQRASQSREPAKLIVKLETLCIGGIMHSKSQPAKRAS